MGATVPAAVKARPQTLAAQVLVAQKVSAPHWLGSVQPTHWPAPSQVSVPSPHASPLSLTGCAGVPALHTSPVQSLLSSGRSVSSTADVTAVSV